MIIYQEISEDEWAVIILSIDQLFTRFGSLFQPTLCGVKLGF